ncbi:MAG: zinc-ribbon domain-containing protein [Clostridia bacterium]|nr:zinc-ribbon domain-containing protein [Clostridia bacterium]
MEFFDDAISKTKEVFETVSQKTGEVITTEKQKFDIASLKSKREKDFAALGKLYYKALSDDDNAPEDAKVIIEAIKAKNAEIERLFNEIQKTKNKKTCPACGASIDNNSVFCNICGAKLGGEE